MTDIECPQYYHRITIALPTNGYEQNDECSTANRKLIEEYSNSVVYSMESNAKSLQDFKSQSCDIGVRVTKECHSVTTDTVTPTGTHAHI